jgi:hypothetical protein
VKLTLEITGNVTVEIPPGHMHGVYMRARQRLGKKVGSVLTTIQLVDQALRDGVLALRHCETGTVFMVPGELGRQLWCLEDWNKAEGAPT